MRKLHIIERKCVFVCTTLAKFNSHEEYGHQLGERYVEKYDIEVTNPSMKFARLT